MKKEHLQKKKSTKIVLNLLKTFKSAILKSIEIRICINHPIRGDWGNPDENRGKKLPEVLT